MPYFDLKETRSYKMSGLSGRRYVFYKGKPVEVIDLEDISKFRMHKDLFIECDKDGNPINNAPQVLNSKSFVKFKAFIANRDEIIEQSNKQAESERQNSVNVNELINQVNKDVESNQKQFAKKKLEKKVKNALECDLCGYIAKDQLDLKSHLDKHSEED